MENVTHLHSQGGQKEVLGKEGMSKPPSNKKQGYIQRFRKEWLLDPDLWSWLVEVPKINGGSGAECKFCGVYLTVKYSDLKNHGRTKKHKNNEAKAPKGQLLRISRPVERTDEESIEMTTENDVSYSVHEIQPGEFVVQKREAFLDEAAKTTLLNTSTASGDYDFGDLIRFDVNDPDSSKPTSNIPYQYLEEKYFEFAEAGNGNKLVYNCKLCNPKKAVKANSSSIYNLRAHIRTNHWELYEEFNDCVQSNIRRGRPKGFCNPIPDVDKYFVFKKEISTKHKPIFECRLCSPISTFREDRLVKTVGKNPAKLELHIRLYHSSLYDEFKVCLEANERTMQMRKYKRRSDQSVTPSDKNSSNELRTMKRSPEEQQTREIDLEQPKAKTRCKKLELDISDTDEALYDDDVADPDFEPRSPGSPDAIDAMDDEDIEEDEVPTSRSSQNSSHLINTISQRKSFVKPPVFQSNLGPELRRFEPLFNRVLVERDESFSPILMKDGVLIPPSNNKACVVAVGKGIRNEAGDLIPLEVSVGDEVIIPEYVGTKVELDGKEYLLFQDTDLLAKFKSK